MIPKKILIAALSFGLIFAGSSAPVFAQATEMTEEQKREYNDERIRKIGEQAELLKSLQSKYDADKLNYSEEETKLQEKQSNLNKLEEDKINKDKKLDLEKENSNSEEEIAKLQAESEELAREIDKQKQENNLLENDLESQKNKLHLLQRDIDRTKWLKSDYIKASKADYFLLEKADARYKVRGYEVDEKITYDEQNDFVSRLNGANTKEDLDNILKEVEDLILQRQKENLPTPNEVDPNQDLPKNSEEDTPLEENEETKALNEAKQTAKYNLEKDENLSDEIKKDFEDSIASAPNIESLEKIIQDIQKTGEKPSADTPAKENEDKPKETPPTPNPDQKPKNDTSSDKLTTSTDNDLPSLPEIKPLDTPQDKKEDTNKDKTPVENPKEKTTSKPSQNYLRQILGKIYPNSATIRIINPSGKDYTTTIKITEEKPQPAKDTIIVKENYRYIKKGSYKVDDLKDKRDQLQKSIAHNKASVRAIELLEELTPKTVAKNRDKINALLKESERLIKEANYALAEYNYVLSK